MQVFRLLVDAKTWMYVHVDGHLEREATFITYLGCQVACSRVGTNKHPPSNRQPSSVSELRQASQQLWAVTLTTHDVRLAGRNTSKTLK